MSKLSKQLVDYSFILWSLVGLGLLICRALSYLTWEGFVTPGEICMSSVAWLLYGDHPLYTPLYAAERYSLQHGPVVYLLIGGIMKLFGSGFLTAKLSGIAALLCSVALSWRWFTRLLPKRTAFLLVGVECWLLMKWYFVFLNRPDSLIFLAAITALYFTTVSNSRVSRILGASLALGLLLNLKVHALFYALPTLFLFYKNHGARDTLVVGGLMSAIGLLPFLHPNISLTHYAIWLSNSAAHGISLKILAGNLSMVVLLWTIPLAAAVYKRASLTVIRRKYGPIFAITALSMLAAAIVGGKNGSGSHHLLGFVPLVLYSVALIASTRYPKSNLATFSIRPKIATAVITLIFVLVTLSGYNGQARLAKYMTALTIPLPMRAEVQRISSKYQPKTIIIGLGEGNTYQFYCQLNPLLVFRGNPYMLDGCALSDMKASGLSIPAPTTESIKNGVTKVWLIPRGEKPFSMGSWYNGAPIFDDTFRREFYANYHLAESADYFDVWIYSGT